MICPNCGNEVTTTGTHCPFCGSPLSVDAGQAQAQYQQQTGSQYQQQAGPQYQQYNQYNQYQQPSQSSMDAKTASIVCYLTWIGLLIAVIAGDKNDPFFKFHLNNAVIILISGLILGVVCVIPIIGWLVGIVGEIFLFVCFIMGLVSAINGECKELPIIGKYQIVK